MSDSQIQVNLNSIIKKSEHLYKYWFIFACVHTLFSVLSWILIHFDKKPEIGVPVLVILAFVVIAYFTYCQIQLLFKLKKLKKTVKDLTLYKSLENLTIALIAMMCFDFLIFIPFANIAVRLYYVYKIKQISKSNPIEINKTIKFETTESNLP